MADFKLELSIAYHAMRVEVEPSIDVKTVIEAWYLINGFMMDFIDDKQLEVTDEQFRELLLELLYHIIYKEMSVLINLPIWERHFKDRLDKGKRIQRLPRRKDD